MSHYDPVELANARAQAAEKKQAEAEAKLAKVMADVEWTMKALRIADLFGSGHETSPAAAEGWLPGLYDKPAVAADAARLDWINQNGRIGRNNAGGLFITLPGPQDDGEVPDIYNIRHILDLCRKA